MATVTIRNLSDEVVDALKERARRNSRSMEAEAREALTRLVEGGEAESGVEAELSRRLPPTRRWSVSGREVMARIAANPPSDEQKRVLEDWAEELRTERENPLFDDRLEDPWERHAAP